MNDLPLRREGGFMIRKLLAAAALVFGLGVAAMPAPAIDFICSCDVCRNHPSLGCHDFSGSNPPSFSCGDYYSRHC
jgi:hypothetical protein